MICLFKRIAIKMHVLKKCYPMHKEREVGKIQRMPLYSKNYRYCEGV